MKTKLLLVLMLTSVFAVGWKTVGKDAGLTGIEVRDREQYLHRLKFLRLKRPNEVQHTVQLGHLYYSLEMEDEAIKEYRRALKQDPENLDVRWFLSHVLSSKGYQDEAFQLAREMIDRTPDDPEVYYWAGEVLEKLDQHEVAKEYFARVDEILLERKQLNSKPTP
ncbi:MAG TPA: tetratricopeptide repeat protein [Candidatus Ozemobacteraceae bacterium]|nr:tetratricopeptide repeat protein [Candidatus Ozemobacteraceae bacterium]